MYLAIVRPSALPCSVANLKWMPALTLESAFSLAAWVNVSKARTGFPGSAVDEVIENGT